MLLRCFILLGCTLLAACAGNPPALSSQGLLHDAAFGTPKPLVQAADLFKLSDAMQQRVKKAQYRAADETDPRRRLINVLYQKGELQLAYDATTTRTAQQTYEAGNGNCLSLVIMTAAFAKAMELPVEYRSIVIDESWRREGNLYFSNGHVNLALGWPTRSGLFERNAAAQMVVDFLPAEEMRGMHVQPIREATVVAMFMNNRAAEALARGDIDEAYWYARESVHQDPHFLIGYNTLGVIYLQHGQPGWAQRVFAAVLEREPDNTNALGNQVQALRRLGQGGAADHLATRLASIEPVAPFHYFEAGLDAMRQRNWRAARDLFLKETARQAFNPEVRFWLAQANFRMGNLHEATHQLELAAENSTTTREHALYAAKLDWLRAHRRQ